MKYVLSHTHWDREWFVTHDYTRRWLPKLFEELFSIIERHPDFEYVLDGQTLIMEDLMEMDEGLAEKAAEYIRKGNLKIGPVYAQLDWRISIPQAIWKNFEMGRKDCSMYGGCFKVGWFMDNFGQISQLPQIMRIFGIEKAVVWRGLRETFPVFIWRSPDGSEVKTIGLIGGYRTLYNLMDTKGISKERFEHEVEKLEKLGEPVVLMDGYDLDLHPEDPRDYLLEKFSIKLDELFEEISKKENLPVVEGELISGKIASVFPGTLSSRTYLKVGSDFVGKLLTTATFLSEALGYGSLEELWRDYLKTLVHDNICGVGVDQIHEGMEEVYRNLYAKSLRIILDASSEIPLRGKYVFSPVSYEGKFTLENSVYELKSEGVGLFRVREKRFESVDLTPFEPFEILIEREEGDAYSSYTTPLDFDEEISLVGKMKASGVERYVLERKVSGDGFEISIEEVYDVFEDLVWLRATIEPKGCCYKLYYSFEAEGEIYAGMPFDVVRRGCTDEDLFGEDEDLGGILLAAREVGKIEEFPMQDFVAVLSEKTFAVLSMGLRSYVCREGKILIPVLRSIEWITKDVRGRSGDAGPKMYVPGARCERKLHVELGVYTGKLHPESPEFLSMVRFLTWPKVLLEFDGKEERDLILFKDGSILPGVVLNGKKIELENFERIYPKGETRVRLKAQPFPFGEDESVPDEKVLKRMREEIEKIRKEIESIERKGVKSEWEYWTDYRKMLEMELSLKLNEMERIEKQLRGISFELNEVRRKKRTFDYLLEMEGGE